MDSYSSSFSGSVFPTEWTAGPCAGQCSPSVLAAPDAEAPPRGEHPRQGQHPAGAQGAVSDFTIFSWVPKTANEKQILKEARSSLRHRDR